MTAPRIPTARRVTFAATQTACGDVPAANADRAEALVREAAGRGAQVVLLQELFETPYFCKDQDPAWFAYARPFRDNPLIARFSALAADLGVVLPLSYFEKAGACHFNSLAMIDADGRVLGNYRKSHIPQGPGYEEKYYFSPGDSGFRVWPTRFATLGVGICWDQWFPEAARAMALMGAEALLYPTAIGSEPETPALDSRDHWQTVICGHAGANILPVVAANRTGREAGRSCALTFYGSSFIADHTGRRVADLGRDAEGVITWQADLAAIEAYRIAWGVFRDRRPDLYGALAHLHARVTDA
jgi:N-carbamoylputrescine amidase